MRMQRSVLVTKRGLARAAALASAAVLAGTLAACSASPGGGDSDTLRVLIAQPQAGAADILKAEYEKESGKTVEITVVPYDQIQTKAILDIQSGTNQYDVIQYWYTSVGALAQAGALTDLTDWIDEDIDKEDFIESIFTPYTEYEGKNYGLPIDGDTHVLFYNKEIFERNGVQPPTTWDEYLTVANTITQNEKANGIYGSALLGAKNAFNIGSTFFNRLATSSPEPIDSQMPDLSTPAALAAAQSMLDAAPSALPSPLEIGFEQALPQFLAGKVGMMEFWTDLGTFAQDPGQSKIVDKWGVVPLPVGPEGHVSGALNAGWAIGVSPNAADAESAKDFVKFATSAEMNEQLVTTVGTGVDPIRHSVLDGEAYKTFAPEVSAVSAEVLPEVQSWPTSPNAPEMISVLNDNLALMLQGNLTPEQALADTEKAWKAL